VNDGLMGESGNEIAFVEWGGSVRVGRRRESRVGVKESREATEAERE
jgi:hypothetical protein